MVTVQSIFDKFFRDKEGRIVLFQAPNVLIIIWVLSILLDRAIKDSDVSKILGYVGFGALVVWALLEVFYGVNYFRRTLGVVVLAYAILSRFM